MADPPGGVPPKPTKAKKVELPGSFIGVISTGELILLKADTAAELESALARRIKQLGDSRISVACVKGVVAEMQAPKPQLTIKFDKSVLNVDVDNKISPLQDGEVIATIVGD